MSCFRVAREPVEVDGEPPVAYPLNSDPILIADGIPIRLDPKERKAQRLVRAAVMASNYTDKVDAPRFGAESEQGKRKAIVTKHIVATFVGLVTSASFKEGMKLQEGSDWDKLQDFLRRAIECSRRYKILNPDLLRTDYVKFLYLIQDAASKDVEEVIGYSVLKPISTVKSRLSSLRVADLLQDPRLPLCITPVPAIKDKKQLNRALRYKDMLVDKVVKEYAHKAGCSRDEIEICVRSLNDATCFSYDNVESTDQLIKLLRKFFAPEPPATRNIDLSIVEGTGGSRLSHPHTTQYSFVLQSLTLWKNLSKQFYSLWVTAEEDMLNPNLPYTLRMTGQGLQRVQPAPTLYGRISAVLRETQQEVGNWVGSEKIHLGDDQVPNAFNFIDKYAQISRIIIPILRTISAIEGPIAEDREKLEYIKEVWGTVAGAQTAILVDFFRHGFDGSGGDNMEDAGSCIDGRLTSAWNWCNAVREKPFYPLFLLAGFNNFDGDLTL